MAKTKPSKAAIVNDLYLWEGTDKKGTKMKGEKSGPNPAMVKAELRRMGITPGKIKKKPKPLFGSAGKPIKPMDIALFSRQMATMMSAGVPLVQSFEMVGDGHENPNMQKLIMAIKSEVEGGSSFVEALRQHPLFFDDLYCNLIHAGEQAGILEKIMNEIATYKEKTEAIKAKVKKALFYPTAILIVAFIVICILLLYVIPQFEDLFKGFGAALPAPTQILVDSSRWMSDYWWILFGSLGAGIYTFSYFKKRSRKMRHALDRMILKFPIIGVIMEKAAIARFARTLSTMFAAGVPLVEAMESVAGAVGNIVYAEAVNKMREDVSGGTQLQLSMRQADLFPNMVVQMVSIGEESGTLDKMLGKVADFYEEEVDNLVDSLSSLLEPIIMAFLGVVIGGMVIAMYLPIFQMGNVI